MWAVTGYRFCRWVYALKVHGLIRKPLSLVAGIVSLFVQVTSGVTLPARARIGPGLYIPHTGYIVVDSQTVIGTNCTLTQGVTIGHGGGGRDASRRKSFHRRPGLHRPRCSDHRSDHRRRRARDRGRCGRDAIRAPRGVVAGNPARLFSRHGSFGLIDYPGMDSDPNRVASLAERDEPLASEPSASSNGAS